MQSFDYECALTGLTQEGADDFGDESDELGDLPAGWTRVTVQRREYNPKWLMIQQVKQLAIQGMLTQIPEEMHEAQGWIFALQGEAQFYALEKDTPMFVTFEDVAYISDNVAVRDSVNEMRETLGLPLLEEEEEEDDGDESHLPHDSESGDDDDDDDEEEDDDDDD